ncbi:hypothetical protein HPB51_014918 [Rhipicephalus microplus]|uniref:Uncharacterized protein n=1 Tax=Rhipicephalus microplus TaxID=6941 RepID=A0A9J6EHN2_RHIMP|nr:hypothetical protein HPB51_014918 [Rhipicephalus microplus]
MMRERSHSCDAAAGFPMHWILWELCRDRPKTTSVDEPARSRAPSAPLDWPPQQQPATTSATALAAVGSGESDKARLLSRMAKIGAQMLPMAGPVPAQPSSDSEAEVTDVPICNNVCAGDADDASDTIDQTSDIVDKACKALLAEMLERQGVTEIISFPDFRDADGDVQTFPDISDEAIVASVVDVSPNDSDEDDMESDNTGDPGPTVAEAAHCISVMRVFAEKRELVEKLAHSISEFEAAVVAARPPRRQMKRTDFVT